MDKEDASFFSGGGNLNPFSVYLEGSLPFLLSLELFLALDNVYESLGEDELKLLDGEYLKVTLEPESEYDVHRGTQFENTIKTVEPSLTTKHILREEVYSAVKNISKPGEEEKVLMSLDKKFPREVWEDKFPLLEALIFLFNEHKNSFDLEGKI